MMDIISGVVQYFSNKSISLVPKIVIPLILILSAYLINDYYGLLYYYSNGLKVDYIAKIEEAKAMSDSTSLTYIYLDEMGYEAIHRENVFQKTLSLFSASNKPAGVDKSIKIGEENPPMNSKDAEPNWLNQIFPPLERTPLWHTVTSTTLLILLLLVCAIYLISLPFPFVEVDNKWLSFLGVILCMAFLVGLVWVVQWLFGLIPVILSRAYLNYTFAVFVQYLCGVIVYRRLKKTN
ncbi:hypothetical protein [Parabacteroides sp. PF5-6]|uniref:hypothetical protein n=1 Tax=Parabacteroides sp. PF5-6 TaxID=1742403 RepID=UPI002404E7AA|nr:hypothetical protein [Parabacteroides sp. PF5-6]MDF9830384.1 hypothetical protein [Parabacteroides sp. PF5-6]